MIKNLESRKVKVKIKGRGKVKVKLAILIKFRRKLYEFLSIIIFFSLIFCYRVLILFEY